MTPGKVDQRSAEAFGERGGGALGELPFRCGSPGDHHPGRAGLKGGEVRLVERYREQAVTEEAFARCVHPTRRLRRGATALAGRVHAGEGEELRPRRAGAVV